MTRSCCLRNWMIAGAFIIAAFALHASPLPPDVKAATSANGRFLVVAEYKYENPDVPIGRIAYVTYSVLEREEFINAKDKPGSSSTYWSESAESWSFTLSFKQSGSAWPLISNDGKHVILFAVVPPVGGEQQVLSLYEKKNFKGLMIRSYKLKELWSPIQIDPSGKGIVMVTDATPEWFAGSMFDISTDDRKLIYKTRWGNTMQIDLHDGAVTAEK